MHHMDACKTKYSVTPYFSKQYEQQWNCISDLQQITIDFVGHLSLSGGLLHFSACALSVSNISKTNGQILTKFGNYH